MSKDIIKEVSRYYTDKIQSFGPSPKGVDWNSAESQEMRFDQLLNVIDPAVNDFSILDYGCGYGSMYEYIKHRFKKFNFTGFDISSAMIDEAGRKYKEANAMWLSDSNRLLNYDYVVASGIFNVRLKNSDDNWLNYILETLHLLNQYSSKGFSFNVLTKYSDKEFMKDYLYYADPSFLFDYCKKYFSKKVALLHDYPLYEFSIVIRKD